VGRPKGIWTPDVVRKRIQATKLLLRLQNHALGKEEMTPTQIKAAEICLRKKVPDLSQSESKQTVVHSFDDFVLMLLNGSRIETGDAPSTPDTVN
jgi:hypothetical protein